MKFEFVQTGSDAARFEITCGICLDVPKDACELECCEGIYCHEHILKALEVRQQCPTCRHERKFEDVAPAFSIRRKINNLLARCVSCKKEDTWNILMRSHKLCAIEIAVLKPEKRRMMYPYKDIKQDSDVLMCAESGSWALCVAEADKTLTVYTVPKSYLFDPKPPAVPSLPPSAIDATMWMANGLSRGVEDRDTLMACIESAVPDAFKIQNRDPLRRRRPQRSHDPMRSYEREYHDPSMRRYLRMPENANRSESPGRNRSNFVDLSVNMSSDDDDDIFPQTIDALLAGAPHQNMMNEDNPDLSEPEGLLAFSSRLPRQLPWELAVMNRIGVLPPVPNTPGNPYARYSPGRTRMHSVPRQLRRLIDSLPLAYASCVWLSERGLKLLDADVYLETAFTLFHYANDLHVKITDVAMPTALYNMACCLSRLSSRVAASERVGCVTRALSWLWAAVGAGYSDVNKLRSDRNLACVRERSPGSIEQILSSLPSNASQPHIRYITTLGNRSAADHSIFSTVPFDAYTSESGSTADQSTTSEAVPVSNRDRIRANFMSQRIMARDARNTDRRNILSRRVDIGVFENPESIERGILGHFSNVLHSEPIGGSSPQTTTSDNGLCLDIGLVPDSRAIVNHFWGDPNHNVKFQHLPAPVLSARQCTVLVEHIETLYSETESSAGVSASATDEDSRIDPSATREDFKLTLSVAELTALLDEHTVEALGLLVGHQYSEIKLRRVQASGQCIQFHLDHSRLTLQVLLNHNRVDYIGGNLVYATHEGFKIPVRAPGSATVHDNTIPHGVTQMREGVRYSLFFLDS